jgi:hypothetical protein
MLARVVGTFTATKRAAALIHDDRTGSCWPSDSSAVTGVTILMLVTPATTPTVSRFHRDVAGHGKG